MEKVCKRWSNSEIMTLEEFCSKGVKAVQKKLPNRTEQAIRVKCAYLGFMLGDVYEVTERFYKVV